MTPLLESIKLLASTFTFHIDMILISCVDMCLRSVSTIRLDTSQWSDPCPLCFLLCPWCVEQAQTQSSPQKTLKKMNQ